MARQKLKSMMAGMPSENMNYQAESDMRTLRDASQIMADPKRMAACAAMHQKEMKGMMESGMGEKLGMMKGK